MTFLKRFFPARAVFCAALAASCFILPAAASAEIVDRIVAVINDAIITQSELNAATALAVEKMSDADRQDQKKVMGVKGGILDSLIEQKLVKMASDKAGIDISEREIDNAVDDIKKQNGITQEALLLALANDGLTYKQYREQLKEQIRQVKFINKEFRSKIYIQPEDIEEYYRQNADRFTSPPAYRISAIFISTADLKKAKEKYNVVAGALAGGEDFAALARQYSDHQSASNGGDLGYLKPKEMDKQLEALAVKLKPGEVSAPLLSPEGYYIIRLEDIKPPAPMRMEDVRDQIHEALFKKVMEERFAFWLSEVKRYAHVETRL